jgi:hypothetical protein
MMLSMLEKGRLAAAERAVDTRRMASLENLKDVRAVLSKVLLQSSGQ